jgi:hypothetical protein
VAFVTKRILVHTERTASLRPAMAGCGERFNGRETMRGQFDDGLDDCR